MAEIMQYRFMINALIAALFTAISCGIIGTYIVSRRMVFIGGGITHSSFGGIGIAYFLGLNPILGAAVFAVLSAFGIQYFTDKAKIRQDSSIAIWWSLGMAVGIIFIALTPGYSPNLMSFLFGSILTVSVGDLYFMGGVTLLTIVVFLVFMNQVLIISFDENFARARNLPVQFFNYLLLGISALVLVSSIRISGVILVLSLLTIPQATANIFNKRFKAMMFMSVLIAFIGIVAGLIVSFYTNLPSGATIILVLSIIFLLFKLIAESKRIKNKAAQ